MSHPVRIADVAVVGAGTAGVEAALAAAGCGLDVVLVDAHPAAGGQVYRAPPSAFPPGGPGDADAATGDALRARLAASAVDAWLGERLWSVLARSELAASGPVVREPSRAPSAAEPPKPARTTPLRLEAESGFRTGAAARFRLDTVGKRGGRALFATSLVLCPGALERVVPFPGWTLPGVIGLAAATILLKSQRLLPGNRVVVAGSGPLVPAVAAGVLKAGGAVAAIVELNRPCDWLRALPRMAATPRLLARGAGWITRIAGSGVPVLLRHSIRSATGDRELDAVTVGPVDAVGSWRGGAGSPPERRIAADALAVGHGLAPATEIGRLLRLRHRFARTEGGWRPVTDEWGRTSLPGCYSAGDGAGVHGAAAAVQSGRLAGLAAATDAGRLAPGAAAGRARRIRRSRLRAARFGAAMSRLAAIRPGMVASIPAETVICRCEDVTRHEIEDAIAAGAAEVNQLKHFTRCGMGPCQGRSCAETVAELLAARIADDPDEGRRAAGQWTGRAPLRPVAMDDLAGRFDYADIPIPPPAPL